MDDFSLSATSIVIPPGEIVTNGMGCVNITGTADDVIEGSETFVVEVTGTDLPEVTIGLVYLNSVILDEDGVLLWDAL